MLVASFGLALAPASVAQDPALTISRDNRTIAVTATDQVVHRAEIGTVHVGFLVYGSTKDAAYKVSSQASNTIMQALTAAGIAKGSIQSDTQSIAETQFYGPQTVSPEERHAKAFSAQQGWSVRTKADDAARVLDIAVQAGANQSGQIDWSLQDPNAAQSEAASKAIQRARTQATAMASGLGVKLGALLYASNQVNAAPVHPMPMAVNARMKDTEPPAPLAINAREIETPATVYAVFALE